MAFTSYLDFLISVSLHYENQQEPKQLRYGQIYMNLLSERKPYIANALIGTLDDPFHRDQVPPMVHEKVAQMWLSELDSTTVGGAS